MCGGARLIRLSNLQRGYHLQRMPTRRALLRVRAQRCSHVVHARMHHARLRWPTVLAARAMSARACNVSREW
jgi:hypothetical protein